MGTSVLDDILYGVGSTARGATDVARDAFTIGGSPSAVRSVRAGEALMADEDARRSMALNPASPGVMDEIVAGYRGTEAPVRGDIALPMAPPPMMAPPRPAAPPPTRGPALRPSSEPTKTSTSTEGDTASGARNPSVGGYAPNIPAWMADRPTPASDQVAFDHVASRLSPGDTLTRVLPGALSTIVGDMGYQKLKNDRAALELEGAKTAQAMDDITGALPSRIRAETLNHVLEDLLPAGSKSRIHATFGGNDALSGSEVGSSAVGEKELGARTIGEEKALEQTYASQAGKTAAAVNERTARQAQLNIIDDLRHKKGVIQAKLAAGVIDGAGAEREWDYEKQLADRQLQALGGGKEFLPRNNLEGEGGVFSTPNTGYGEAK